MTNEQKELVRASAETMAKTMTIDTLLDKLVKLARMLDRYNDLGEHEGRLMGFDYSEEIERCEIAIDAVKAEIKSRVKEN